MSDGFGRMYLTEDLPGTGGRIKERPEDFLVEEIPLYEFSGAGGFTFLLVETTNLSTLDLVARLRRNLDLADHQVGLAGWKDKHAVTRQWISVPRDHVCSARLRQLGTDGIKILEERHHPHKLRTGHLLGNRFSIMIRNPEPGAEEKARGIIRRIRTDGLPNFYGRQRFGAAGDNPETGRGLLLGTRRVRSVRKRKLFISAFASLVFNFTLKERMERGLFTRLLQGDIAKKHPTGGLFRVSSPAAEQKRADCLEISATGPVWGKKMMQPGDEARDLEEDVLRRQGLTGDVFRKQPGSRRSLRVPLEEISLHQEPSGLRLEFYLPKGAYATVLLDEIMKTSSF